MVFASDIIEQKIIEASIDWSFDNSDHAMVKITYVIPNFQKRGPGLPRVKADILENVHIRFEVENRLNDLINQATGSWNAAEKWEYIKVCIRSVMWEITSRENKVESSEIDSIKMQMNTLKTNKATLLSRGQMPGELEVRIDNDIKEFETQLQAFRDKKSKDLAFRARSKWFNEGEKSNKYFLNLIKKRNSENEIASIQMGLTQQIIKKTLRI